MPRRRRRSAALLGGDDDRLDAGRVRRLQRSRWTRTAQADAIDVPRLRGDPVGRAELVEGRHRRGRPVPVGVSSSRGCSRPESQPQSPTSLVTPAVTPCAAGRRYTPVASRRHPAQLEHRSKSSAPDRAAPPPRWRRPPSPRRSTGRISQQRRRPISFSTQRGIGCAGRTEIDAPRSSCRPDDRYGFHLSVLALVPVLVLHGPPLNDPSAQGPSEKPRLARRRSSCERRPTSSQTRRLAVRASRGRAAYLHDRPILALTRCENASTDRHSRPVRGRPRPRDSPGPRSTVTTARGRPAWRKMTSASRAARSPRTSMLSHVGACPM